MDVSDVILLLGVFVTGGGAYLNWLIAKAQRDAATAARNAVEQAKVAQEKENRPLLAVVNVEAVYKETDPEDPAVELYPVRVILKNVGRGPATMFTLDLNVGYTAHLGWPITLAPGSESYVKVWLPAVISEHLTAVMLEVHYWDFDGKGYTLCADLGLGWEGWITPRGEERLKGYMHVRTEKTTPIPSELLKPARVEAWPRATRFRAPTA